MHALDHVEVLQIFFVLILQAPSFLMNWKDRVLSLLPWRMLYIYIYNIYIYNIYIKLTLYLPSHHCQIVFIKFTWDPSWKKCIMIHPTTHNVSVWPPYPFPSLVNLHHLQRKVLGILTAFKLCVFPLSWIRISCSEMRVCSAMCKTDQNQRTFNTLKDNPQPQFTAIPTGWKSSCQQWWLTHQST